MDDMRAMMQDELRQALFGLLPPLAAINAPAIELAPATTAIPHAVDAPLDNAEGQPMNATRNAPNAEVKLEDIENYMIEKEYRESLEQVQEQESK